MSTIWTIGYEKLLPPELVAELSAAGVERVIDVRFRPAVTPARDVQDAPR